MGRESLERTLGARVTHTDAWIANAGNITPFHCAGGPNLFCMIHGEKRWTLVSPAHSHAMYPAIGRNDHALYVDSKIPGTPADALGALAGFPLFRRAPRLVAHLKAGDVLYNPAWWWHQVENLTETVAVAQRILPTAYLPDRFSLFLYALSVSSRPHIMLRAIRGQRMRDDVLHLADVRRADPAWREAS